MQGKSRYGSKGAVEAQWGKLTKDDLDEIDGNVERLVGIVQERYGYARERAEKEVQEFSVAGDGG